MNEGDRKKVKKNLVFLEKKLKLDEQFQALMIQKTVFSQEMLDDIMEAESHNLEFCMKLVLRGPRAFRSFLESLIATEQYEVARVLEPTMDIQSLTGKNDLGVAMRNVPMPAASSTSPGNPAPAVESRVKHRRFDPPKWGNGSSSEAASSSRSSSSQSPTGAGSDDDVERDLRFESNGVLKFEVKPATMELYRRNQNDDCYHVNLSKCRGRVLIININSFDHGLYDTRVGSETDVTNLDKLFQQLGYIVTMKQDVSYEQFLFEIDTFVQREDHREFSSCFVFIMSHGDDLGNGHWGIVAKDGKKIDVEGILDKFTNTRAKSLIGKPKVIVVNACRGQTSDKGVAHRSSSHSPSAVAAKKPRTFRDGHNESRDELHRTFDDMLYVKSTAFGFASHRETKGSWLITALCHVFAERACDNDVESLFRQVDEKLKRWRGVENQCQTTERSSRGHNKHLFLYPGLSG